MSPSDDERGLKRKERAGVVGKGGSRGDRELARNEGRRERAGTERLSGRKRKAARDGSGARRALRVPRRADGNDAARVTVGVAEDHEAEDALELGVVHAGLLGGGVVGGFLRLCDGSGLGGLAFLVVGGGGGGGLDGVRSERGLKFVLALGDQETEFCLVDGLQVVEALDVGDVGDDLGALADEAKALEDAVGVVPVSPGGVSRLDGGRDFPDAQLLREDVAVALDVAALGAAVDGVLRNESVAANFTREQAAEVAVVLRRRVEPELLAHREPLGDDDALLSQPLQTSSLLGGGFATSSPAPFASGLAEHASSFRASSGRPWLGDPAPGASTPPLPDSRASAAADDATADDAAADSGTLDASGAAIPRLSRSRASAV
eukprot:CAMPEP_0197399770 /NCGR_PEP_ID=MMETSP1165-20131217/15745_1 /TAXON_ID=284809 /ORGANISM="Chrysocystis fragilis, Strain CCMP3189" /LENGTH=376 /DNA_ID=CAMNT_0042925793 /DNA_START=69 /DNA_END=1198 /DNA_ORIENTATION=+